MPVRGRGIDLDTFYVAQVTAATEVSITATSSATGNTCLTSGAITIANGGSYLVEVYAPYLTIGSTNLDVELYDGSTFVTSLSGHLAASVVRPGSNMRAIVSLTPGAHTLKVTAFVDAGTGKFGAGDGATGDAPNAFMLVRPM